jgi:hypothetical protein
LSETLVLHRAGVEVADRDDLVLVEVELQAEALLVPGNRALQAIHCPAGLVELARLHVDGKVAVPEHLQVRRDQREQVRGLREGIVEPGPARSRGDPVAVRQQHRVVRAHRGGVDRHHVGPVDEPGDAAEALGLALGDEAVLRRIQAFQLGVLLRHDAREGFELEALGHVRDRELLGGDLVLDGLAVQGDRKELDLVAVQDERTFAGVAVNLQLCADQRMVLADIDVEIDRLDAVGGRGVILEVDGPRLSFFHWGILMAQSPYGGSAKTELKLCSTMGKS